MPPQEPATPASPLSPLPSDGTVQALHDISFQSFLHSMSTPDWIVFIVLCVMSVLSWYFIFGNIIRGSFIRARARKVIDTFWQATSHEQAAQRMRKQPRTEPFSNIALACLDAVEKHRQPQAGQLAEKLSREEFVDRALRQAVTRESLRLERGLTVLATIGSSAVYVGLLGTVIGIYYALTRIGAAGESSITAVAGPVGQALIMTAFGLFAAIPAVLAYNFFTRGNRATKARFQAFARDLHDVYASEEDAPVEVHSASGSRTRQAA